MISRNQNAGATGMRSLPPEQRTLPALLELQAATHGDRPLLEIGDMRRTYAEVADTAARTAGALQAAGIRRGDSVAVLLVAGPGTRVLPRLRVAWCGRGSDQHRGARRGAQLEHMLTNSRTRLLVIEAQLVPALEIVPRLSCWYRVWVLDDDQLAEAPADCFEPMSRTADPVPAAAVGPQDTLGHPLHVRNDGCVERGAALTGNSIGGEFCSGEQLEITADDVLFTCLPLFQHQCAQWLYAGAHRRCAVQGRYTVLSVALLAPGDRGASHSDLPAGRDGRDTVHELPNDDRSHTVRIALGPGVPASFHEGFHRRFGVPLMEGYGSTERPP